MLKNMFIRLLVFAIALLITVYIGQLITEPVDLGIHTEGSVFLLLAGGVVLGIVNALLAKPLRSMACMVNCMTFGLAGLVINALLFWGVGNLDLGYRVDNFWGALFGSIIFGLLTGILSNILKERK